MKKALTVALTAALVTTAAGIMGTYTKSNADNIKPVPTRDIEVLNNDIQCMYPGNGQVVSIVKENILNYIKAMKKTSPSNPQDDYYINDEVGKGMTVATYYDDVNTQYSKKIPLIWDTKDNVSVSNFEVLISTKEDLSDAKVYETKDKSLYLENLYAATTYYWKVKSKDG